MYTIQEMSRKFNLNASTLRYYEKIGLLPNVLRTETGLRLYNDSHTARLNAINCFKRTGLPISKMLLFFQYEESLMTHADEMCNLMIQHKEDITTQIETLREDLKHIEHKIRYYTAIKHSVDENLPLPAWNDFAL